jgi:hypothetical protein
MAFDRAKGRYLRPEPWCRGDEEENAGFIPPRPRRFVRGEDGKLVRVLQDWGAADDRFIAALLRTHHGTPLERRLAWKDLCRLAQQPKHAQ